MCAGAGGDDELGLVGTAAPLLGMEGIRMATSLMMVVLEGLNLL